MSKQLFTHRKAKVIIVKATPLEQRKIDADWARENAEWDKLRRPASAGDSVAAVDAQIHNVIRASARRHSWEAVEDKTPMHELVARETADPRTDSEMHVRQEHFNMFLTWLFGAGPHPTKTMRRLYSLAYHRKPELIAYMTMADLGLILNETRANFSWRLKQLFPGIQSRSQKRAGSTPNYAAAARGNRNRRRGEQRKKRKAKQS
jgi:hypothetical protein